MNKKLVKNATWIIACKLVQAVLNLVVTMISARYLGPAGYGIINYAASLVAFAVPIMQLGLNSIIVMEIVHSPETEGEALGTSMFLCFLSSFLSIAGVVAFTLIANRTETETIKICFVYSLLLIFQGLEILQYWFQAKLLSKYTSIFMLIAYTIVSAYKIVLLITNQSIYWFALSQALDFLIIDICLIVTYKIKGKYKLSVSLKRAKLLLSKGHYYIIPGLMITIFAQTDRVMIKLMIGDAATGYYSAAITCAGMLSFVFTAIIDSFRPVIFESKKKSTNDFEKNVKHLYTIIIYLSLFFSLAVTIFAKIIVMILYGKDYMSAITALRIVVWYTTFSYLGSVRNIWILAEQKQRYLLVINLSGAILNVVLNFIFIPIIGINGAAFASLITQIFSNVIMGYIVKDLRENNRIMIKSLQVKEVIALLKNVKCKWKK